MFHLKKVLTLVKNIYDIKKKIIKKYLLLVADKILKKKEYPLCINQKCYKVIVSPYIETDLKNYQVKSSFFFHIENFLLNPTPQEIKKNLCLLLFETY